MSDGREINLYSYIEKTYDGADKGQRQQGAKVMSGQLNAVSTRFEEINPIEG